MPRTAKAPTLGILARPTRHLFFTGKGGVGKTSLACAVALALVDRGRSVLLVSTDPASNLDEMLGVALRTTPTPVPGVANLHAMNIDPEAAAEAYRGRVLEQMERASNAERSTVQEQLSGACTTEIAAFDESVGLLVGDGSTYDHIVFDTAPTGHTLRLLSLPKAWTGFLKGNDRGASCLGPHSGLKMQAARFQAALTALGDPALTTVVLVARPDLGAVREAARTSAELRESSWTRSDQRPARSCRPDSSVNSSRTRPSHSSTTPCRWCFSGPPTWASPETKLRMNSKQI